MPICGREGNCVAAGKDRIEPTNELIVPLHLNTWLVAPSKHMRQMLSGIHSRIAMFSHLTAHNLYRNDGRWVSTRRYGLQRETIIWPIAENATFLKG